MSNSAKYENQMYNLYQFIFFAEHITLIFYLLLNI